MGGANPNIGGPRVGQSSPGLRGSCPGTQEDKTGRVKSLGCKIFIGKTFVFLDLQTPGKTCVKNKDVGKTCVKQISVCKSS